MAQETRLVTKEAEELLKGDQYVRAYPLWHVGVSYALAWISFVPVLSAFAVIRGVKRLFGWGPEKNEAGLVQRKASRTALMVAMFRHIGYREGWTNDSLARHFVGWDMRLIIDANLTLNPRFQTFMMQGGFMLARTTAGDNMISNLKPTQVVLLGAGLDTRAHRLPLPEGTRFYEVDIAPTQQLKIEVAKTYPQEFKGKVTYVAVDFSKESFMDRLREAEGFDPTCASTIILFEGVTMYLPWEALEKTMTTISKNFAPGTILGMDVFEDMTSCPEARERMKHWYMASRFVDAVERAGEPFQWGVPIGKTPKDIFPKLGFELLADLNPPEVEKRFFTSKSTKDAQAIAKCPEFFHYLVLKVAPH